MVYYIIKNVELPFPICLFWDPDGSLYNHVHSTNLGGDIPGSTDTILRDSTHNILVGGDIPTYSTNTGKDILVHNINLGEADDGEGEGAATIGNHLDEEGGSIAVSGEDVLVGVGWGGRRELVEGNDEGEDDKSGDEGLHLEPALGQGGGGGYSLVFPHRCSCFAF
ncbi:hypothetical protein AAC387_Pa01g2818 [Persea americana]